MTVQEALVIVAVHGHPHYNTENEKYLLEVAKTVLRAEAKRIEGDRFP